MKQRGFYFIICLLATLAAYAQPAAPHVDPSPAPGLSAAIIAKSYEDSIVIRWAPVDPVTWLRSNASGWRLTRLDISIPGHPVRTDLGTIKPEPEAQMLNGLDTTAERTKYLTVAWKMLYGKQTTTVRNTPRTKIEDWKGRHGALVLRYGLAMMAADYYPPAADALGLRFVDRKVTPGGKYAYLISSVTPGDNGRIDSASVYLINQHATAEPTPQGLEAYGFDQKIEVRWQRRQTGNFAGFFVERSDDGGNAWRTLTKNPFNSTYIPPTGNSKNDSLLAKSRNTILRDQQVYVDSIPRNYTDYAYRIRAVNAFGEISPYTAPVIIRGRDLTPPPAPRIDSVRNIAGRQIKLYWKNSKPGAGLAGYFVNRGATAKGPFHLLTPAMLDSNATSFIDTAAAGHAGNFYVVLAVDTAHNVAASAPVWGHLIDSVAPAAPLGVHGTIDSTGVVRLAWTANAEPDLLGYQVYFSYDSGYRFSQATKKVIANNSFVDTLAMNFLNRKIYYKVVAMDRNDNRSPFSAAAELRKPVLIPPSPPVAGTIAVKDRTADIEWLQSRGEGVSGYAIYRKGPDSVWVRLGDLQQDRIKPSVHFRDSIAYNTDYYYAAETLDSSGLHSARSFAVHVRSHGADSVDAPQAFRAQWDAPKHAVGLSWNYTATGDYFIVVYRSVNGGALQAWHSFDRGIQKGMDTDVKKGSYRYALGVVHRDRNAASGPGPAVPVEVTSN
jgi:hypothetical protein